MVRWEVPPSRRLAFVAVLVVAGVSVLVTTADFRLGGYTLAAAFALAAAMRALLPERFCLGLLVRSRRFDVAVDVALATALAVGARVVPG